MKKLLFIGQLPPPYNGQNLQIQRIKGVLDKYAFEYRYIKLDFSDDSRSIGVIGLGKVVTLLKVFFKILWSLLFYRPHFVHYPPAGPNWAPMLRDFILLFPVRLLRFPVIYRFHAGGISDMYGSLNPMLKWIYRFVYFYPDYGTCMSDAGKFDAEFLSAKQIVVLPNGVEDKGFDPSLKPSVDVAFTVLFIGFCISSKGINDFLEVIERARVHVPHLKGRIIGDVIDLEIRNKINQAVDRGTVSYEGLCTGQRKNELINQSHLLLFPTFYPSENFPTVILEAFSYGLPVIATKWRGVVDQITDGHNGKIHQIGDVNEMANSLVSIAKNKTMYDGLSKNARETYLDHYTLEKFEVNFVEFFDDLKLKRLVNKA